MTDVFFTRFIGRISDIRPDSGLFDGQVVEVEVQDWIGFLSEQELGPHEVTTDKTADEAIDEVLIGFPIQPEATDFDTGTETFPTLFDTDGPASSMASFLSKMCRNEWGRLYLIADGTLQFQNKTARDAAQSIGTVDGEMTELDVEYLRADVYPIVQVVVSLASVDANPDRLLWSLAGAPAIQPGQTIEIECPYTDVEGTQGQITAKDIVDPPFYEFGSVQNFVSDDMHADLSVDLEVGATKTLARLTNENAGTVGYLNDLQLDGKGIIFASPLTIERRTEEPIYRGIGERRLVVRLEQIADLDTATQRAEDLLAIVGNPERRAIELRFDAGQSLALAEVAVTLEPSSKITVVEDMTGVSGDYFVERLFFSLDAGQLWVTILASPA